MSTAILERSSYELQREKRMSLIPCTSVPSYDLVLENPVTGEYGYGRYLGTIMNPASGAPSTVGRPVSYASFSKYNEYATTEMDGYNKSPTRNLAYYSASPNTASSARPMSALPPDSYHTAEQTNFRPISPEYRPVARPKSAMASLLSGANWGAAGRKYEALPVYMSRAMRVEDIPIEQYYDLTKLKKSNLRSDDQVLPRPEACEISKFAINLPFPAEHPYSSHIVEKAVFPTFAETPDDGRTGVDARRLLPKAQTVPSNPMDVIVVKKTKGHGERHEIHQYPGVESLKRPLHWPGDYGFDQQVKAHGGKQQYYPAPTKKYVPNLEKRPPEMQISERTANALSNIERDHWTTAYSRDNTGYGTIHAMALDNYDDKVRKYRTSGEIDDKLYPRSIPEFDPARPVEGRLARALTPKPPPQVADNDWRARPYDEPRKMTENEIEEQRLLRGREYATVPVGMPWDGKSGREYQQNWNGEQIPEGDKLYEQEDKEFTQRMEDSNLKYQIQQMEAGNRWRDLQSSKPHHDIQSLHAKYSNLQGKGHADVFYNHEGKYQEERAGLYKTDYIPEKLAASMNNTSGRELTDTSQSHVDAINYPSRLNVEMDALRAYSGIRHRDQPNNTGRVLPSQVLEPELMRKYQQKLRLQPNAITSRSEIQENGFIGKESEYQDLYNHEKYLQENAIHPLARSEPIMVMSGQNHKLGNVRDYSMNRSKNVHFSTDITVATGAGYEPIRISSAPMNGSEDGEQYRRRIEESMRLKEEEMQGQVYMDGETLNDNQVNTTQSIYRAQPQKNVTFQHRPKPRGGYNLVDDIFVSKSTNFAPTGMRHCDTKSSYEAQFPRSYSMDFKDDPRFQWSPGMDRPRPRTTLMDLQDSFSKTEVMRDFNRKFPELHADLRAHVTIGRRHTFDGIHAQTFRGN